MVPSWFAPYLGLEQAATPSARMKCSSSPACCRLRTTPTPSCRSVTRDNPEAGHRAAGERADAAPAGVLHRPMPPRLWAVIDEAALRRPIGGASVARAQLEHLIEMARLEPRQHTGRAVQRRQQGRRRRPGHAAAVPRGESHRRGVPRTADHRDVPEQAGRALLLLERAEPPGHRGAPAGQHEAILSQTPGKTLNPVRPPGPRGCRAARCAFPGPARRLRRPSPRRFAIGWR